MSPSEEDIREHAENLGAAFPEAEHRQSLVAGTAPKSPSGFQRDHAHWAGGTTEPERRYHNESEDNRRAERTVLDGGGATADQFREVGHLEVTGCDLVALAQWAYQHSQQMGSLHAYKQPADLELPPEVAGAYVQSCRNIDSLTALDMEWVNTRAVRLLVLRASDDRNRLFLSLMWPDHTREQYADLAAFALSSARTASADGVSP